MPPRAERIERLEGFKLLDSRGNYTIMVEVTAGNVVSQAFSPSGASKGPDEAKELPAQEAVNNIPEIGKAISHIDIFNQAEIDQAMIDLDGTKDLSRLGANAVLAVSLAVVHTAAKLKGEPLFQYVGKLISNKKPNLLPVPMMNVINGGVHAKNGMAFQEFMIVPFGGSSFTEAIDIGRSNYFKLGEIIEASGVGDEGGYSPSFSTSDPERMICQSLDWLVQAMEKTGYAPGKNVGIALDPAAGEFYKDKRYHLSSSFSFSSEQMARFLKKLTREYPIVSIEDGMAPEDEEGWRLLTSELGGSIQLVGDDLFCTNPELIDQRGIKKGLANAVLIKLNQIGTLTQTLIAIEVARAAGMKTIISHRSGETEDTTIADLAVATDSGQIKTGAPARGERTGKYNRLLRIEQSEIPKLGFKPEFAGATPFSFR